MLRQEVTKLIKELDSGMLSQKAELLIKKILIASVEVYEIPGTCGIRHSFDQVFDNPNAPTKLDD